MTISCFKSVSKQIKKTRRKRRRKGGKEEGDGGKREGRKRKACPLSLSPLSGTEDFTSGATSHSSALVAMSG